VKAEIRRIKTEYWEKFTADMEHDLYKKPNEYVTVTTIPGEA